MWVLKNLRSWLKKNAEKFARWAFPIKYQYLDSEFAEVRFKVVIHSGEITCKEYGKIEEEAILPSDPRWKKANDSLIKEVTVEDYEKYKIGVWRNVTPLISAIAQASKGNSDREEVLRQLSTSAVWILSSQSAKPFQNRQFVFTSWDQAELFRQKNHLKTQSEKIWFAQLLSIPHPIQSIVIDPGSDFEWNIQEDELLIIRQQAPRWSLDLSFYSQYMNLNHFGTYDEAYVVKLFQECAQNGFEDLIQKWRQEFENEYRVFRN